MNRIKYFVETHPDLFKYLEATEKFPHDQIMAKSVLKILPEYVTPNRVTAFRIVMTPVVFLLISQENYVLGIISFLFVAFTDLIDGSLARTKNQITRFGMMFDPLADKFLIGSLVLLLVFRYLNFWLGVALLGMEIVFILSALMAKYKFKTVKMANIWGKTKMLLQVTAVFLTLMALLLDYPGLLVIASWLFGMAVAFAVISLFRHGI